MTACEKKLASLGVPRGPDGRGFVLTHLSERPVVSLTPVDQTCHMFPFFATQEFGPDRKKVGPAGHKPRGLWATPGQEWERFCREHRYNKPLGATTRVLLGAGANVLVVANKEDYDGLMKEYGLNNTIPEFRISLPYFIRWGEVAKDYHGIYVAEEAVRYFTDWDVESACIWNFTNVSLLSPPAGA